jgi:uncharacterized protein YqhQ
MSNKSKFSYGGQAVIEGVMMRSRKVAVTAVRRPSGDVSIDVKPLSPFYTNWMRRTPLLRGIIVLIESLILGMNSLFYSANVAMEEENEEISPKMLWGMVGLALVMVVLIFFIAPLFLTRLGNAYIPNTLVFNIIEGIIRLVIFIAYLKLISLMPDIKRVFMYHGAEHKTVNAHEAGVTLDVESVKKYSTAHVRCGTSFLFIVMIVAIVIFAFIGRPSLWLMVLSRILLVPIIAALSYEIIYFGGKHAGNPLVRALLSPGLFLQALTTSEPEDKQLEVAIEALKKAVEIDELDAAEQTVS